MRLEVFAERSKYMFGYISLGKNILFSSALSDFFSLRSIAMGIFLPRKLFLPEYLK